MINPHTILTDLFNELPMVVGFKPNYKWGDDKHLNQIMKLYQNNQETPYPLIYNVSNHYTLVGRKKYLEYAPLSLVIATQNVNTDWHNGNRWATSYNNVLFPIADYIFQTFRKSQVFMWDGDYDIYEYPNYSKTDAKDENKTIDIIDALRIDVRITITDKCPVSFTYEDNYLTT